MRRFLCLSLALSFGAAGPAVAAQRPHPTLVAAYFASKTHARMKVTITAMSLEAEAQRYRAVGTITLEDEDGRPVVGAAVQGEWQFQEYFLNSSDGATDEKGEAKLYSQWVRCKPDDMFALTVVEVHKGPDQFDPACREGWDDETVQLKPAPKASRGT